MDLTNYKKPVLDKRATRHNDLITQIMEMDGDKTSYKEWCGRTAHLSYEKIQQHIQRCTPRGQNQIHRHSKTQRTNTHRRDTHSNHKDKQTRTHRVTNTLRVLAHVLVLRIPTPMGAASPASMWWRVVGY